MSGEDARDGRGVSCPYVYRTETGVSSIYAKININNIRNFFEDLIAQNLRLHLSINFFGKRLQKRKKKKKKEKVEFIFYVQFDTNIKPTLKI